MLVKLAFLMQRLKKYLKKFCHDQQRWGGTAVMTGDIELIGVPPVPPQLKKTLKPEIISVNFNKNYWFEKYRIDTSSPFVLQKILLLIEFTLGHLP